MKGSLRPITEKTIVPISIGMLITMGAGLVWLVALSIQTSANTNQIAEVRADQRAYLKNLEEIKLQLANIQGGLGIKYQNKKGD